MKSVGFGILAFIVAFGFFAMVFGKDYSSNTSEEKTYVTWGVLLFSFLTSFAVILIT